MRRSILAVLIALALLAGIGLVADGTATAQAARVMFNSWVFVTKLTVEGGGATIDAGGLVVTDGGVTVTDDGLTLTDDDLTVTSGNIGVTAGNLTLTSGNATLTSGDATLTSGDLTLTSGHALLSSGNLTMTSGNATLTAGNLTLTAGNATLTDGDLTLTDGHLLASTGNITVTTGSVTVGGQVLATGDVRTGTDMQVAQVLRTVPTTAISVTNGAAFTPTGTYQPLTSAGTVTPTITATDADAGDILILVNESATTINLADTGTTKLSAAAALGQYDTLVLLSDGTNWIELSRTDN